ncbi:uncharacterized protein LOC110183152 [Drosophila serrata]|uniref:uncharacterized protein LOC110183152 n=1 Tax=Drosophila serrata TaxID=7274 RepID=UPI000A1D11C2|nr:uncharacterized protein LOC110183152 [Drosophila serrata]
MVSSIYRSVKRHPRIWLFATMQIALMMSMIRIVFKIELPAALMSTLARTHIDYKLSDLIYSPLLSGCAMSALFHGYGLVYFQVDGCLDEFLCKIRNASLTVWDCSASLMFLPWLIRVGDGLIRFPFYKVESGYGVGGVNFRMLTMLAVCFWCCLLFLTVASLLLAVNINRQLKRYRRVRAVDPELIDYAQRINALNGFELIRIVT